MKPVASYFGRIERYPVIFLHWKMKMYCQQTF